MRNPRAADEKELISEDAAEYLGVHRRTFFRMVERGRLSPCREGGRKSGNYFDIEDLDRINKEGSEEQRRLRNKDLIDHETMISTADATRSLDVTRQTLWRWEKEGLISGVRSGNRVYYDRQTIKALVEGRKK